MTRIFAALFAVLLATPTLASDKQQVCDAVGTLAQVAMVERQNGTPLEQVLPYANVVEGQVRQIAQNMIRAAYAQPMADGAGAKQSAINDFVKSSVAECLASF